MIASFVGIMPTRPALRTTPAAEQLVEMLAVRRHARPPSWQRACEILHYIL
jgi:hypothetical protein